MFWNFLILSVLFLMRVSSLIIEPLKFHPGFDKGILQSSEGFLSDMKQHFESQNQGHKFNAGGGSDQISKKSSGFNEGKKGIDQANEYKGGFNVESKQNEGHHDLQDFAKKADANFLGNKKSAQQGEGSQSKGHNSKGEQNYHHKDEYSKTSTFFDEENDEGDQFESHGEKSFFDGSNLGRVNKDEHDIEHNEGSQSRKGASVQGSSANGLAGNSQHKGWFQENGDTFKGDQASGFGGRKIGEGFTSGQHFGNDYGSAGVGFKNRFLKKYPYF